MIKLCSRFPVRSIKTIPWLTECVLCPVGREELIDQALSCIVVVLASRILSGRAHAGSIVVMFFVYDPAVLSCLVRILAWIHQRILCCIASRT